MGRGRGVVLGATVTAALGCTDIDTTRQAAPLGTVGEEVYGAFCDRMASQVFPEDLQGDSYRAVCHKSNGQFADTVDVSQLPPITDGAVDVNGVPVSVAQQQAARTYALGCIAALVRRRADFVAAVDATLPPVLVPVKDTGNPDRTRSCGVPATDQITLPAAVADMLGRFGPLYVDGTMPRATQSLAAFMQSLQTSPDAQAALARLASRIGYRPAITNLGATRPAMSYAELRTLANATLAVLSPDAAPYDLSAPHDAYGNSIPVAGPANAQLEQLLATMQQELRTATVSAALGALVLTPDSLTGRQLLSRPRSDLEALGVVMMAEDPSFGAGISRYIVQRDTRGVVAVPLVGGVLPAPFVDNDQDGLPDLDALGQFVSSTGVAPPSPFFAVDAPTQAPGFDTFDRALAGGQLLYGYIDTTHTFTAAVLNDLGPLVNPDLTQNHESLMDLLEGAYLLFGSRDQGAASERVYTDAQNVSVTLAYNAFHPENAPLLDLLYATAQVLGDPSADDALALTSTLVTSQQPDMARITGAALAFKGVANTHPEAVLPPKSTFWDEVIDVMVQVEQEPGLLVDVLRASEAPGSGMVGVVLADTMRFKDHISYDRANLNGPPFNMTTGDASELVTAVDRAMPDAGWNRSAFQKFVQLVHDTNGVAACNKAGAVLHGRGVPIAGTADFCSGFPYLCSLGAPPFRECEVFKIDNLAQFYIDSLVGQATLTLRPDYLRNGVAGIGAATVDMMQQSSGITGFWDPASSHSLRPQPQYLDRQVYFDLDGDSPNPGDINYITNHFLTDLIGAHALGTVACTERTIVDPAPTAPDASADGMVHGLRTCGPGLDVVAKDPDALFVLEDFGAFSAFAPLIQAFASHHREDLYLALLETVYRHWADTNDDPTDCSAAGTPQTNPEYCTQDGAVTYEPLLAQALPGDLFPALQAITIDADTTTVGHCTQASGPMCTQTVPISGVHVLANASTALLDPVHAAQTSLTDRHGGVTALRNDGTTNPQVTPIYLLTAALAAVDSTLANDPTRMAAWKLGRSQLVDQFLSVKGSGAMTSFADVAVPNITPALVGMLRSQMSANCPSTYVPPFARCAWARDDLTNKVADTVKGPLFSAVMDLVDAVRANDGARTALEALLQYLASAGSQNDALAAMLATANDLIQVLGDDANLVPLYQALAPALAPTTRDGAGHILGTNLVDAGLTLLSRVAGQLTANGVEICADEVDPNGVLPQVLARLVTPMVDPAGRPTQTPVEVLLDIIADLNRVDPAQTNKLGPPDFAAVTAQVEGFLTNKQFGLEQFYEVVRKGTE